MTLRLGLIGRGRWGKNIERTLASFSDVSISVIPEGRTDKGFDGVLIATPSATHAEIALPYIEAGIATFIEKPMATSIGDAERIQGAALRSGAPVFVGHLYLYHPAFLAALELLPALGPVKSLVCEGANDRPRTDSSVLWDWLPHDLSIAHTIFGHDADGVQAWRLLGDARAEAAAAMFGFGQATLVSLMSWHSPIPVRRVTVVCEQAVVVLDGKAASRQLSVHVGRGPVSYPAYSAELSLTRELRAFLETVRSGKSDASHLEIGIATVRTIRAVKRSIAVDGRPVSI